MRLCSTVEMNSAAFMHSILLHRAFYVSITITARRNKFGGQQRQYRPNSTCGVTSRHDTTRIGHAFWNRKKSWRAVLRLSDSTARHSRHDRRDSHDTCSGASPQRGLGWTCPVSTSLFPEVVPEIDANPQHKRLNLYTRALLLMSCVSCRDVTQQVEFGLIGTSEDNVRCLDVHGELYSDSLVIESRLTPVNN